MSKCVFGFIFWQIIFISLSLIPNGIVILYNEYWPIWKSHQFNVFNIVIIFKFVDLRAPKLVTALIVVSILIDEYCVSTLSIYFNRNTIICITNLRRFLVILFISHFLIIILSKAEHLLGNIWILDVIGNSQCIFITFIQGCKTLFTYLSKYTRFSIMLNRCKRPGFVILTTFKMNLFLVWGVEHWRYGSLITWSYGKCFLHRIMFGKLQRINSRYVLAKAVRTLVTFLHYLPMFPDFILFVDHFNIGLDVNFLL